MNSAAEAALISGGWATAVAVLGYAFNRATAKATIEATNANAMNALDAAHDTQLWEKKASAYVDAIAGVRYRHEQRPRQLETVLMSGPKPPNEPPVNWTEVQGRLFAYASPGVLTALRAANDADLEARTRYREWQEAGAGEVEANLAGGPGRPADVTEAPAVIAAAQAVTPAIQAANDKDTLLIAVIRADLALRPSERAGQPPAKEHAGSAQP